MTTHALPCLASRTHGRLRRFAVLFAVTAALVTVSTAAWAYWLAASTTSSNGASAATSVNAGATPTVTPSGATVTVSWAASTLASGQAVTGYQIKRYDANTLAMQTILTACTGTVATTSCVESAVPNGLWKYSVTPVFATNWRGTESAKSSNVRVDTVAPINSITLSSVSGAASQTGTTIYYKGSNSGSFTLTNAVTDAGSGPSSSQTVALSGTSTGWTHTGSTVSTPTSGPYVSNAFSWVAATTSAPGEAVTGRDSVGNTAVTNLSFVNDTSGPTGGSISYVNGAVGSSAVSVTFGAGTDAGSGLGTRLLQRASAPLANGICGTYGTFATVTGGTNPTSPFADPVTSGNCYQYQYVVADVLGNATTVSSTSVATTPYGAYYAFDAGSGTTAIDSTGDLYTGTLQGAAGWSATGKIGASALKLNGTSTSWVDVASPVIDTSKSYTVAAWVNLNNVTGYQSIAGIDGSLASPFVLQLDGGTGKFRFALEGSDVSAPSFTNVEALAVPVASTWYHVAGVYDQANNIIKLYINGVLQGTATAPAMWTAPGHTAIGRAKYNGSNGDFLNGAIDEVHFYDRALSAAEIQSVQAGPSAFYSFDAGAGTTALDTSQNGYTATLQGGATWTAGKVGANALNLNGTSTSWASYSGPVIDTSQSYTVAAWVNLTSTAPHETFVSIDGNNISPFYLQYDGKFAIVQRDSDSTSSTAAIVHSAATPVLSTWYLLVGVYDKSANTIQLYVNGVSQGTSSTGTTAAWRATGATTIGRAKFGGAPVDFASAAIDEVRLYGRALSAAEVAALP